MPTATIRGYFAALAAGNLTFWITSLIRVLIFGSHPGDEMGITGFLVVAVFVLVFSLMTTIVPFIGFLAVSRILGIRAWPYFVVCGIAMGLFVSGLLIGSRWTEWQMWVVNSDLWQHLSASGAIGGLVYWRVAGRNLDRGAPFQDA